MKNEEIESLSNSLSAIAHAITPLGVFPGHDATGGTVGSLTEAVMGLTAAMIEISNSINRVAEALDKNA